MSLELSRTEQLLRLHSRRFGRLPEDSQARYSSGIFSIGLKGKAVEKEKVKRKKKRKNPNTWIHQNLNLGIWMNREGRSIFIGRYPDWLLPQVGYLESSEWMDEYLIRMTMFIQVYTDTYLGAVRAWEEEEREGMPASDWAYFSYLVAASGMLQFERRAPGLFRPWSFWRWFELFWHWFEPFCGFLHREVVSNWFVLVSFKSCFVFRRFAGKLLVMHFFFVSLAMFEEFLMDFEKLKLDEMFCIGV